MMEIGRKSLVSIKDWDGKREIIECYTRGNGIGGITVLKDGEEYFVPTWNIIRIKYLDKDTGIERIL